MNPFARLSDLIDAGGVPVPFMGVVMLGLVASGISIGLSLNGLTRLRKNVLRRSVGIRPGTNRPL